ncbi:protein phosphatase 1 regulatory subunit 14C [Tachysurus ichikawai]
MAVVLVVFIAGGAVFMVVVLVVFIAGGAVFMVVVGGGGGGVGMMFMAVVPVMFIAGGAVLCLLLVVQCLWLLWVVVVVWEEEMPEVEIDIDDLLEVNSEDERAVKLQESLTDCFKPTDAFVQELLRRIRGMRKLGAPQKKSL